MNVGDFIFIAPYENSPKMGDFVTVVEATEKAIKVKSDEYPYTLWLPKSALKPQPRITDSFIIKPWFVKNITDKAWKKNIFGC